MSGIVMVGYIGKTVKPTLQYRKQNIYFSTLPASKVVECEPPPWSPCLFFKFLLLRLGGRIPMQRTLW